MTSKKTFLTDDQLLKILENDDWSDIEVLSDDDDVWEPENDYQRPNIFEGSFFHLPFLFYIIIKLVTHRKMFFCTIFRSRIETRGILR